MVAIVAGSSGMVGTALLHELCAYTKYTEIRLLVRRSSGFIHAKVNEQVVDLNDLQNAAGYIKGDVLFCCLGSTRKKTPRKEDYYRIDHDYPLNLAHTGLQNGISQFHLVSSLGANPHSKNFYLRMKGETEADISRLPFSSVHIYRPSILTGNRQENRLAESISIGLMKCINPLLTGKWKKFRSISAEQVAKAMTTQSLKATPGVHIYESDEIQTIQL